MCLNIYMNLQFNDYYVISIPYSFEENILSIRLIARYIGFYIDSFTGNISYIFTHRIKHDYVRIASVLTHMCQNYNNNEDDLYEWETHIYIERFNVVKTLSPIIRVACMKFRQLLNKRKTKIFAAISRLDLPCDIQQYIFNMYFGKRKHCCKITS